MVDDGIRTMYRWQAVHGDWARGMDRPEGDWGFTSTLTNGPMGDPCTGFVSCQVLESCFCSCSQEVAGKGRDSQGELESECEEQKRSSVVDADLG